MAFGLNISPRWIIGSLALAGGILLLGGRTFRRRLIKNALVEWERWHYGAWKETDPRVSSFLVEYYQRGIGQTITLAQARSSSFHGSHQWSAVFISYLMAVSGAGSRFHYSGNHSIYIRWAVRNRINRTGDFRAYRITEVPPQPGDLVCFARQQGVDYDTTGWYASHCDLVVERIGSGVRVIGGNYNNTVTLRTVVTDERGFIRDSRENYFAVIKTLI